MPQFDCLNSSFKVVSYNGGPILGQYGINQAFQVAPGGTCRPTATRAGQTFDVVLEYNNPDAATFTLSHVVVVSPKFEEVTSMLKAGVVFVHDQDSPYFKKDEHTVDFAKYSSQFNQFPKTLTLPTNTTAPIPAAMFNYPEKTQSTIAVADGPSVTRVGKYLHIKFTESFDDDYNIDFGHFYIIGAHNTPTTPTIITEKSDSLPAPTFTNVLSNEDRAYLLANNFLSTPTTLSEFNQLLTTQNQAVFFQENAISFISTVPIHQYLDYIEGQKDIATLTAKDANGYDIQDLQTLLTTYRRFAQASALYTTTWRKYFTSDLITANLQKETGTEMVKAGSKAAAALAAGGGNNKQQQNQVLEYPQEVHFFTIDPTTPYNVRIVALSHVGETQPVVNNDIDHQDDNNNNTKNTIVLSKNQLFSIVSHCSAGSGQRYEYNAQDHIKQNGLLINTTTGDNDIAKKSIVSKIFEFIQNLSTVSGSDDDKTVLSTLMQYFARFSIVANFSYDYFDQKAKEQTKTTATVGNTTGMKKPGTAASTAANKAPTQPTYSKEQCDFFFSLLTQRISSQQSYDDVVTNGVMTHPIYDNIDLSSYHALHVFLQEKVYATEKLQEPIYYFVLPYDRTNDKMQELMGLFMELTNILKMYNIKNTRFALFDVLYNNINPYLYSFTAFLDSIRLFVISPPVTTVEATATTTTTTTTTAAKPTPATKGKATTPAGKKPAATKAAVAKKFTLPLIDITSLIPPPTTTTTTPKNKVIAIDLIFDKMIDKEMIELANETEQETPPPTVLEFLKYITKVQNFLTSQPQYAAFKQTPIFAGLDKVEEFYAAASKLDSLLGDISYLRMMNSTMIPTFYSRFVVQTNDKILKEMSDRFEGLGGAGNNGGDVLDVKKEDLFIGFIPQSNDEKLFKALHNFGHRAEVLLRHIPQPIGTAQIPYSAPQFVNTPDGKLDLFDINKIDQVIPNNDVDWHCPEKKNIPQLITLTSSLDKVINQQKQQQEALAATADGKLPIEVAEEIMADNNYEFNIVDKLTKLRTGTDSTVNLFNSRARCVMELRDALQQIQKYITLFSDIAISVIHDLIEQCKPTSKNSKNAMMIRDGVQNFFTYYQQIYHDLGLIYSLSLFYDDKNTQNKKLQTTMNEIIKLLNIPQKSIVNLKSTYKTKKPIFDFNHFYNQDNIENLKLDLYNATIATADYITSTISEAAQFKLKHTFEPLSSQHNFVEIQNEEQLQRCLEGYVLLTPQAAPAKKSLAAGGLSRAAVANNKANSVTALNNKKFDDADDRIIVLWITHTLDGTYEYIDELSSVFTTLVTKYKNLGKDTENNNNKKPQEQEQPQNIVLARIDIDQYPDVLDIFGLEDPQTSLAALLFVQSGAERVDLRLTAIEPTEFVSLVESSLVTMVENPELYTGADDDDDDDELVEDEDDETTEVPE